jgi:hypothetical protein
MTTSLKATLGENHSVGHVTAGFRYENSMLYQQGDQGGRMQFMLVCDNLPLGTVVGFYCPDPGPVPPISLPPVTVTNAHFIAGVMSEVPANFSGTIYYFADFNTQPPADARIRLQVAYIVES